LNFKESELLFPDFEFLENGGILQKTENPNLCESSVEQVNRALSRMVYHLETRIEGMT
jgi:hypothetical protein